MGAQIAPLVRHLGARLASLLGEATRLKSEYSLRLRVFIATKRLQILKIRHAKTAHGRQPHGTSEVIVYDPFVEGHHVLYALKCASKLAKDNRTHLLTPAPDLIRQKAKEHGISLGGIRIVNAGDMGTENQISPLAGFDRMTEQLATLEFWFRAFRARYKIVPTHHAKIYFPYLDVFIPTSIDKAIVEMFDDTTWAGIYFHPKWTRLASLKPPSLLSAANLESLSILDAHVHEKIAAASKAEVKIIPDFTDATRASNQDKQAYIGRVLNAQSGRKIVSLLGSLERRKGLLPFLNLACARTDIFFVCAGKLNRPEFSDEELHFIDALQDNPPENMHMQTADYIHPESCLNELIALSDALFLAYENFYHSSNFITKAAIFGVPVITSAGTYMSEVTEKYNLGTVASTNTHAALSAALEKALSAPQRMTKDQKDFAQRMSAENFII